MPIRRAVAADVAAVVALREEAARWLVSRGITQWLPGEVGESDVLAWLVTGRVYVLEQPGGLVGVVRVAWDDDRVWGPQPPVAGYLHGLVVARSAAGRGLGVRLLAHGEGVVARTGRHLARLDHAAGSASLAAYYSGAGYDVVGRRELPAELGGAAVTLREKRLVR